MSKPKQIAKAVLDHVGGTANVKDVFHCMTRLRFRLNDDKKIILEDLKKIEGVLGAQFSQDTLQVIIGPAVDDVYRELIAISGLSEKEKINENLDAEPTVPKPADPASLIKSVPGKIVKTFANCMEPLVPLFVALGMLNVVAAIIGPTILNLVPAESDLYNNFYYGGQAIIYFLPIFVAITASRYFGTNTFVSVTLAGLMLYPDLVAAISSEAGFTIFGITAPNVAYNGQLIPILLVVWGQKYLEKLLNRVIPNSLKVLAVAFLTIVIMMPLQFCLLGPLGFNIGSLLVNVVLGLYEVAGPVETLLVCAFIPFMTAMGVGRPIFFACLSVLMSTGVEHAYMPIAMVLNNFVVMGIAAGYMIKAKNADHKKLGMTCLVASVLGGVSEPTLFGILLPNKKAFLPTIIGGAASGLYLGLMKVGYYQFGPSNVLSVLGFMGGDSSANFINGCIAAAIGLMVTFVMMLVLFREEEQAAK